MWWKLHKQGGITEEELEEKLNSIPVLMDEAHGLLELYNRVRTQVITAGMGEPIGLNFMAIEFVFKCYGIENHNDEWLYLLDQLEWIFWEERRILKSFEKKGKK